MKLLERFVLAVVLVGLGSCRPVELPEPPGAGSVQGLLVYAGPGGTTVPAGGASVELLGTSVSTTADAVTGFFRLSPVPTSRGTLLIRYDADHDGAFDHNRSISLESIQAGPGKSAALGTVTLSGNASIRGAVLRSDALASASGHGGSNVFTPEGPYLVYTGDNGRFSLDGLPEGEVTLAFFRAGYLTQETTVSLHAGETLSLPTIILTIDENAALPVQVSGTASLFAQASSAGVEVSASGGATTTTAADGTWSLALAPGRYVFGFTRAGFGTVTLRNIAVTGTDFQVPPVVLTPGTTSSPDLDAGQGSGGGAGGGSGSADAGADAGAPDAGAPDAGAPDAGGPDAGPPLLAVIDPLPAFRAFSTSATLNGTHSTGGTRPYLYRWTQTRGTAVTLSANNSTAAGTPSFTTPALASGPTVLGFTLVLTDALDAGSAPSAEVLLPVGGAPTAAIAAPPATVYPGQLVVLDGTGSTDPGGQGVTGYLWTVSPAGLVTSGPVTGSRLTLTMPATNATPQLVTVTLTVTNGVGIASTPATATFTLTNTAAPSWTVSAGAGQTVRDGQAVTLTGTASSPGVPGATFTFRWTPAASDGGTPWLLQDPTAVTTSFAAPMVVGPNQLLNFTLTATSTSGLTPAQGSATTFVNVLDRTAPTVLATGIDGQGHAGLLGTWVDFSEPVDPAALGSVSISPGQVVDRILAPGGTRLYVVTNPLSDGASYTLSVGGVRDLSPQLNSLSTVSFPFVASRFVSPAFESVDTSAADPHPGLVLRPGTAPGSVEALVFGRNGSAPWFLQPIDPFGCAAAPCPVPTDATAPTAALTSTPLRGPRGLRLGGTAYATLQARDFVNNAPAVVYARPGAAWAPFAPTPPGALVSDGTKLYSLYVESGLKLATWDPGTATWGTAGAVTVTSDATLFNADAGISDAGVNGNPAPVGAMSNPLLTSYTYLTSKVTNSNDVRAYQQTTVGGPWNAYGPWTSTLDHRMLTAGSNGFIFYSQPAAVGRFVGWTLFGNANNGGTVTATGGGGFDALVRGSVTGFNTHVWYAAAINGLLQVRMSVSGTGVWTQVLGPGGVDWMNNSQSCTADSPELAQLWDKVAITWAEQCAGGPWRIYFRLLN